MKRCVLGLVIISLPGCLLPEKQCLGPACPWDSPHPVFTDPAQGMGGDDDHPTLNDDMTEMYFVRGSQIWVTTRKRMNGMWTAWSIPEAVRALATDPAKKSSPELADSGRTLYFASNLNNGQYDIWMATRTSNDPQGWTVNPGPVTQLSDPMFEDKSAAESRHSDVLVLASQRGGLAELDLFMAIRHGGGAWEPPTPLTDINTPAKEAGPFLSSDLLTLYFYSSRPDHGNDMMLDKLYRSTRSDSGLPFTEAVPITELNSRDAQEANPWVSSEERHIFFSRDDILYEAER